MWIVLLNAVYHITKKIIAKFWSIILLKQMIDRSVFTYAMFTHLPMFFLRTVCLENRIIIDSFLVPYKTLISRLTLVCT